MAEAGRTGGTFRARLEEALAQVRPAIHADGGDIELVDVVGNNARVRLLGACVG